MSLLLDALKRAEQEKLARQGESPAAPAPSAPAAAASIPRAAPAGGLELQPMASSAAMAANATLGAPPPRGDAHTAQAVFSAKAANADGAKNRGMIFATIGAVA